MSILGKDIYFSIHNLEKEDLKYVKKFKCGNEEIDKFFHENAINDTKVITKVVWRINEDEDKDVKINKSNSDIIAMYSLSCSGMFEEINKEKYLIPAIEIKHFAMDIKYQDLSYSNDVEDGVFADYILSQVVSQIRKITETEVGADKIMLFSVPNAAEFYGRNFFEEIIYKDINILRYLRGCIPMVLDLRYW